MSPTQSRTAFPKPPQRASRSGLSLLEVILAVAIMAASMALLGELIRIGGRHATSAVNLTKAQMHCETVLSEIAVGIIPANDVADQPMEIDPDWLYSVAVTDMQLQYLISVRVSVRQAEDTMNPRKASMTRLMIDPEAQLTEQAEDQEALDEAAS